MSRRVFFRQSGWMVIATLVSGICFFLVHFFSKLIPEAEYSFFATMVSLLNCIAIPAIGLQMVFVQQTAAAVSESAQRQLRGTMRGVLTGTLILWLLILVGAALFQESILRRWQIANPLVLWMTLLVGLAAIWMPIFGGILQGRQNFLWFGWAAILNGAGRLAAVGLIVTMMSRDAASMMVGVLIGTICSLAIFIWQTREVWSGPTEPFAWRPWLARILPLTLGLGAFQFMFSADPVFVQSWFDKEETGFYMAAGTLSRALVVFTGPIVWVMFPKIVRSVASDEKTDVMWLTLGTTAVMACLGALALCVVAPIMLKIVYKESYLAAVPLLRWFSWSMVPLALANVLINNLMARNQFRVVPWLVGVVVLYTCLLLKFHDSFLTVIKLIGLCNLLFLGVGLTFTWLHRESVALPAKAASGASG